MEYSRHKEGEPDGRGTRSMMEIHADAQRQAMQEAGLGALRRLVPKASAPTCLAALEATGWDADEAYKHIKAFLEVEEKAQKEAAVIAKREAKKRKKEAAKMARPERSSSSESRSGESDSESSSSSSSSEDRKRREKKSSKKKKKKKKEKKKKTKAREKRRRRAGDSDSDSEPEPAGTRSERRLKTKTKRSPENREPKLSFGARGFIRETDKNAKEPEFRAWLEEVKKVNIESVAKHEEKAYFKEYAEDYNTNTLPDDKFYDLDRWTKMETFRRAEAARAGVQSDALEERLTFDDEAERKAELDKQRQLRTAEYKQSAYERMKESGDLQNLREQTRLIEQRKQAYNVGDTETVERINKILAPDEPGRR